MCFLFGLRLRSVYFCFGNLVKHESRAQLSEMKTSHLERILRHCQSRNALSLFLELLWPYQQYKFVLQITVDEENTFPTTRAQARNDTLLIATICPKCYFFLKNYGYVCVYLSCLNSI